MTNHNIENLLNSKSISLVGFMAVGKSTIGKKLSTELNLEYFDTDKEIEKKEGMSINDIFETFGENYFRNIELDIVSKLLEKKNSIVLALGGGAYLNESLRKKIKKTSISIWLDLDIETILSRLEKSKTVRPIAKRLNSYKDINELFKKRKKIYEKADIKLNISSCGKGKILKSLLNHLTEYLVKNEKIGSKA